jgi:carbonic anhydrase
MKTIDDMLDYNRRWSVEMKTRDPRFFSRHADGQRPAVLSIGCSDSRVPIDTITGVAPGDMFVYRNIANQLHGADLGAQAVLAFAVDTLGVQHILVMGHTGCGGVNAAIGDPNHGLVDHWLASVRLLALRYRDELDQLPSADARLDRLVTLNVVLQIYQLSLNPTVRDAWQEGRPLSLHGMVYDIESGLLQPVMRGVDSIEAARAQLAVFRPA